MTMFSTASVMLVALATAAPAPTPLPTLSPALVKTAMPSFGSAQTKVSVKTGQPFQIRLQVTSGTGYSWQPMAPIPPGITLLGSFQQPHGKMMPGGPGQQVLVFRAQSAGQVRLSLEYVRPWERGAKPAKVQTFTVTAHK